MDDVRNDIGYHTLDIDNVTQAKAGFRISRTSVNSRPRDTFVLNERVTIGEY